MLDKQIKNLLEVITTLKTLISNYEKEATPRMPLRRIRWALCCAVECVEKQVAKKVKNRLVEEEIYNAGGFTRKVKRCFCPVCDSFIEHGKHCYNCGQKLDWSEV